MRVVYLPRYRPVYLYSLRSAIERECVTTVASAFINTAILGNACSFADLENTLALPSERAFITRSVLRALRPECGLRVEKNEIGEERMCFDARLYGMILFISCRYQAMVNLSQSDIGSDNDDNDNDNDNDNNDNDNEIPVRVEEGNESSKTSLPHGSIPVHTPPFTLPTILINLLRTAPSSSLSLSQLAMLTGWNTKRVTQRLRHLEQMGIVRSQLRNYGRRFIAEYCLVERCGEMNEGTRSVQIGELPVIEDAVNPTLDSMEIENNKSNHRSHNNNDNDNNNNQQHQHKEGVCESHSAGDVSQRDEKETKIGDIEIEINDRLPPPPPPSSYMNDQCPQQTPPPTQPTTTTTTTATATSSVVDAFLFSNS